MNNKYIKYNFNGLTDEVHNWDLIKTSAIFKPEYKDGNVELVGSYLNAAKCIYDNLIKQNHPDNKLTIIRTNSLIIPFLYLCRHTIELSIKTALSNKKIVYGNIHDLNKLLSKLELNIEIDSDFIRVLDLIDDKGMWLRYNCDLK